MKSKDQILLEQSYQKVLEGWYSERNRAMGYDDDFDDEFSAHSKSNKQQSPSEDIVDVLGKYFRGKEGHEESYIYAGKELRKLGITGTESDIENIKHAHTLAKYDEPPFDFDISGILDQIRGPLGYQDDIREL